jgi:hypothetical protein
MEFWIDGVLKNFLYFIEAKKRSAGILPARRSLCRFAGKIIDILVTVWFGVQLPSTCHSGRNFPSARDTSYF